MICVFWSALPAILVNLSDGSNVVWWLEVTGLGPPFVPDEGRCAPRLISEFDFRRLPRVSSRLG